MSYAAPTKGPIICRTFSMISTSPGTVDSTDTTFHALDRMLLSGLGLASWLLIVSTSAKYSIFCSVDMLSLIRIDCSNSLGGDKAIRTATGPDYHFRSLRCR